MKHLKINDSEQPDHFHFDHTKTHLGGFHSVQAQFGVIGSYVEGSGFEDIYHFRLSTRYNKALLKGKHYNHAWVIRESFVEAITRMFIEKYVPSKIKEEINLQNIDVCVLFEN